MKAKKKKIIILVSLVVLLAGVACLNYFLTVYKAKSNDDGVSNTATPTFFTTYRDDRQATRSQEILYLEEIMASATADESTVSNAEKMYLDLVSNMETETNLENLIKSYGFEDCIVTISNNNVNVVIKDSELTFEETAQVLNIIIDQTSYTASDIVVIPYV